MNAEIDTLLAEMRKSLAPQTPEQAAARQRENDARRMEDAMIVHRALATPAGKALLDLLWRKFGSTRPFDASLGFWNGAALGFERTGQSSVLNYLGDQLRLATEGPRHDKPNRRRESAGGRESQGGGESQGGRENQGGRKTIQELEPRKPGGKGSARKRR